MSVKRMNYSGLRLCYRSGDDDTDFLSFIDRCCGEHIELKNRDLYKWQAGCWFMVRLDGRVVGVIGQLPQAYARKDSTFAMMGFGVSLIIDPGLSPDMRKQTGRMLLDAVEHQSPFNHAGVGMVPDIIPVYERRQYYSIRRDDCRMYVRPLNTDRLVEYTNRKETWKHVRRDKFVTSVAGWIGNKWNRPLAEPFPPIDDSVETDTTLAFVETFDPAWDIYWSRFLRMRYDSYFSRNADYLNWKLRQPSRAYIRYVSYTDRTLRFVDGYIILRHAEHPSGMLNILKICDLVGTDEARLKLMTQAMRHVRPGWTDAVMAISSTKDRKFFRKCGLWVSTPYCVALPNKEMFPVHVSFFDSDLDNLW